MVMARQVSAIGMKHIGIALYLIEKKSPAWFRHIMALCLRFVVDPEQCGNDAAACSWSEKYGPGILVFAFDPGSVSPVEVARILRHESHHYEPNGHGCYVSKDHICSDRLCSDLNERAQDEIYVTDDYFIPQYASLWAEIGPKLDPTPSFLETAGQVVVGGVAVAGVMLIAGSILEAIFGGGKK